MYLLDNGTIIYFLKNDPAEVDNFRLNEDASRLSVITIGYSVVTDWGGLFSNETTGQES